MDAMELLPWRTVGKVSESVITKRTQKMKSHSTPSCPSKITARRSSVSPLGKRRPPLSLLKEAVLSEHCFS